MCSVANSCSAEPMKVNEGVEVQNSEEVVTIERFGKVLDWFGPIIDLRRRIPLLDKITLLLREKLSYVLNEVLMLRTDGFMEMLVQKKLKLDLHKNQLDLSLYGLVQLPLRALPYQR